jgi:hypothetical protein
MMVKAHHSFIWDEIPEIIFGKLVGYPFGK